MNFSWEWNLYFDLIIRKDSHIISSDNFYKKRKEKMLSEILFIFDIEKDDKNGFF